MERVHKSRCSYVLSYDFDYNNFSDNTFLIIYLQIL